ncbi:hypothetical protein CVT26_004538 [Gymnopilus dilepis]|uniref:RNase H type-1 domain-containing protein n=1 Tax=Gymnopilus dilepis TaxID=231916 RepID=A0A409YJ62_9AGAR|nr:hypothetical protein CVT26_004538 [Gymnopilus dilepis]
MWVETRGRRSLLVTELVAVIQALAYENWWNLFDKLVIATDSEYVVQGCTERYETWVMLDWWTPRGRRVSNTDLWIELMELIDVLDYHGCAVEFWKIPRRWNSKADAAAKRAAATARATAYSYSANLQTVFMGHTSIVSPTYHYP